MTTNRLEYDLIRLWLLATEGRASDDDLKQLNRLLEENAEARKCLFQVTRQQSWLIWNGATATGMGRAALNWNECQMVDNDVERDVSPEPCRRAKETRAVRSSQLIALSRTAMAGLQNVHIPLLSYRMAAIAACIAVIAAWITLGQRGELLPVNSAVASDVRAEVIGATVCVWSGGVESAPALGHQFHEGDTLQLLEGVAELRIAAQASSADLQLEGPVAVVIGSNGISNLRYGKIAIQTAFTGGGFQVATSFGRVVAGPGAEIGISTFGNSAEVHVFEGVAELESPWIVADDGQLTIRQIEANEALRINQTGEGSLQVSRIAADHGMFTTRLSMDANYLAVKPGYVNAVRKARPVAYWRFEAAAGNRVRNEMGDHYEGELRGDYRWVGPSGNQALELGVAPNPGSMRVNDSWDDVLADNFTCEFWMRPSHYHVGTVLAFPGPFDEKARRNTHGIAVEIQGGWGGGATTRRVRFLNRVPLSITAPGMSLFSGRRYATRRWQHVVAVRDDDSMKLYLDGEVVQVSRPAEKTPAGLQLVVGQLYTDALERPFIGYLDELAIYGRALSADEVREHYRVIRSEAKPQDSI